jgi:peptidoglycan/LPS O-acetylase OafA/YrhL
MIEVVIPQAADITTIARDKYRPEINGIRAFAVVAVIINHFNKDLLPSGYLGVDIFFVISGYVITLSLAGRESKNFLDFLAGFYERRIKRLVPALVVFVLITSVLICLFNPDPGGALELGWKSLFGISNINLYRSSTNYFAQSTELNPFTHTWSLGVEEQFYLLFPFLIWFSGFGQQTAKGSKNLFIWVGALTVASLVGFIYLYQVNQPAAYFLMPTRFWEMAAGCLTFIGFQKRPQIERKVEKVPPLLVVAAMVGVMFLPVSAAVPATIAVVALSSILTACLKKGTATYKFFVHEKIVFIGLISYSLYLWHWTVLSISRWTIGIHWWSVPFQIGLMLILAILSFHYVETPLRRKPWGLTRWQGNIYGLTTLFAAAGLLFGLIQGGGQRFYLGRIDPAPPSASDPQRAKLPTVCNLFEEPDKAIALAAACGLAKVGAERTIYVVGDSHGWQFLRSLTEHAQKYNFNLIMAWGNACPFPAATSRGKPAVDNQCFMRQRAIEERLLKKVRPGDVVLVGNQLFAHYTGQWDRHWRRLSDDVNVYSPAGKRLNLKEASDLFEQSFKVLSDKLNHRGVKVILYLNAPQFSRFEGGQTCSNQWFAPIWLRDECHRSKQQHMETMQKFFGWSELWRLQRPALRFVFNAAKYASCQGDDCTAENYLDSNHFKEAYANFIWQKFIADTPDLLH